MQYQEFIEKWRDDSDSILCHTSGSTGTPKSILLPKREMIKSGMRTINHFKLDSHSHLHSCISPDYIGGKMMAVRSEVVSCKLTWESPSNRPLADYHGETIDLLAVVPSQMHFIIDNIDNMPEIKHIIVGGAAIPAELKTKIAESKLDAWETYGMTETASHIALRKVSKENIPFKTLEGVKISLNSESCLEIEIEGWQRLTTNDVVEIINDREFIIRGRIDNVINSGGKKIHPEQIEPIIESILDCEVMITSLPDDKWGERVVLIIEKERDETESEIIAQLKHRLPKEAVPKEVIFKAIPHTANGKKKRK